MFKLNFQKFQHTSVTCYKRPSLTASAAFSATASAVTDVFFRRLGVDEIEEYLALDEHCDKAGAYAIQGRAMIFVERINGCYYNVVGLPVDATAALFRRYVLSLE